MAWDWDFFQSFDDTILIPLNLTQREMAMVSSALNTMREPFDWDDLEDFYSDVLPTIGQIDRQLDDSD